MMVYYYYILLFFLMFLSIFLMGSMYGAEFTPFLFVDSFFILYFHHIKFKNIFGYILFHEGKSNLKQPYSRVSQVNFGLTILSYKTFNTLEPIGWHRNIFGVPFFIQRKYYVNIRCASWNLHLCAEYFRESSVIILCYLWFKLSYFFFLTMTFWMFVFLIFFLLCKSKSRLTYGYCLGVTHLKQSQLSQLYEIRIEIQI